MKNYLKSQIKNLPMIIIVSIIFCGINTLATNHLFKAKEVEFDNTNTNIESTNVGDAIDELYTAANNFATYDTRLQGVETKIGTGSLNTTSNTLIGGVNELNTKIIIETQEKTVSGYDGTMKESYVDVDLKSGYTGYPLRVSSNAYNTSHYIAYFGGMNQNNGRIYFEHNLASNVYKIYICILWIKN